MKKRRTNNRYILQISFLLLLFSVSTESKAQNDTISDAFKTHFVKNITELAQSYCWLDSNFYQGKFESQIAENIEFELKKLRLGVLAEYHPLTARFYNFLEEFEIEEKQRLVKYFSFYEKIFEMALLKYNLPIDLKYLAPAISAMNPMANGYNKKAGIWQLTHFQALTGGLRINKLVDERYNVKYSTEVFTGQIKKNLQQFSTPDLAVAAYLVGNTKIRNAIYVAGDSDVNIETLLPVSYKETVAAFQAMAIFLSKNKYITTNEKLVENTVPDTVYINRQLHFQQIAEVMDISVNQLFYLNPEYKFSIIPGNDEKQKLILPEGKWDDFVLWRDSIYKLHDSTLFQVLTQKIEYPPAPDRQFAREPVKNLEIEGKSKIKYRLKTGDVLGFIAEEYDVRVADLKYWNNIYNERRIQAGRYLDIFVDDDKAEYYRGLANPQSKTGEKSKIAERIKNSSVIPAIRDLTNAKKIEHVVKSGESPYVIAKKYSGVTSDEILEWNNITDARKIQIGQKLIVYVKE